jgi:Tol biopolymer transport system component
MKWISFSILSIFCFFAFSTKEKMPLVIAPQPENQFQRLTDYKEKVWIDRINWTPDGEYIFYRLEKRIGDDTQYYLVKYNLKNRSETILKVGERMDIFAKDYESFFERCYIGGMEISPSGKKILFYSGCWHEVIITDIQLKNKEKHGILPERFNFPFIGPYYAVWSHDERKIIFACSYCDQYDGLAIYDIEKRKSKEIFTSSIFDYLIAINYKLRDFYLVERRKFKKGTPIESEWFYFNPITHQVIKKIKVDPVIGLGEIDNSGENILFIAKDLPQQKEKVLYKQGSNSIARYNIKEKKLYIIALPSSKRKEYHGLRLSPDGKKIAFFAEDSDGKGNLWLLELKK